MGLMEIDELKYNRITSTCSPFEVEIATEKLKMFKSPGNDQIPAEMIRAGGETLYFEIHDLLNFIFNGE
jgi:hypothetical protein